MLMAAPILVPLASAVILFLIRRSAWHKLVSLISAASLVVIGGTILATTIGDGPQAAQMGGWAAPYGITLAADTLSGAMVLITGIALFTALMFAVIEVDEATNRLGFHAL
ncbi:MAG: Na+/H+ antiporter subunit D, partial [Pseudomonadota bacterium]